MADSDRFDEQCKKEIEGNLGNLEPIWDEPFLFSEAVLPEIASDVLPSPLKEFAVSLSANLETPESAAVLCCLSVLATAVQGKFDVAVSKDYHEPLNLKSSSRRTCTRSHKHQYSKYRL